MYCLKNNNEGIAKSPRAANGRGTGNAEVRARDFCTMGSKSSCIDWPT